MTTCRECRQPIRKPERITAVLDTADVPLGAWRFVPVCRICASAHGWLTPANQHAAIWPNGLGYEVPGVLGQSAPDLYTFCISIYGGQFSVIAHYYPHHTDTEPTYTGKGDDPVSALAAVQAMIATVQHMNARVQS